MNVVHQAHDAAHGAQQKAAVLAYIHALNQWDFHAIERMMSDSSDFKYDFRPASLQGFGTPGGFDKVKLMEFLHTLHDNVLMILLALKLKEFKFFPSQFGMPKDITQSENKLVLWIDANGTARDGSPYKDEYIVIFTFKHGDSKFHSVVSMCDSRKLPLSNGNTEAPLANSSIALTVAVEKLHANIEDKEDSIAVNMRKNEAIARILVCNLM
ncbi:hypothetical protein P7C70_g1617, partial [Phenoliferia sp. Uapishka_3]